MTERDAIRQVVEQSITTKVDIETLRKWCKERYEKSIERYEDCNPNRSDYYKGQFVAYREMIRKLDELEVNNEK